MIAWNEDGTVFDFSVFDQYTLLRGFVECKYAIVTVQCTSHLISWYFEPSQPEKIISGLKTNFNLFPNYSAHKSPNHKFCKIYKISPATYLKKIKHIHTNIKHNFVRRISPFGIAPVKNSDQVRTCLYHEPFRRFINTRFRKKLRKECTGAIKCFFLYKFIPSYSSAMWLYAAHANDRLASPSCYTQCIGWRTVYGTMLPIGLKRVPDYQ